MEEYDQLGEARTAESGAKFFVSETQEPRLIRIPAQDEGLELPAQALSHWSRPIKATHKP